MNMCLICEGPIDGPALSAAGGDLHPACLAERLPHDAIVALLAAVGFVLAYTTVVMAG